MTDNVCERCKEEYDDYLVFIKDEISDLRKYSECDWNHLCKPCRMAVTDYGAYLTESEQEELDPKEHFTIKENFNPPTHQ